MKVPKQDFLAVTGIGPEDLCIWLEEKWLVPDESSREMFFSDVDIARAHLVRDLQDNMGINDVGVSVVLDLVDQLYGLRRTLSELRYAMRDTGA